MGKNEENWSTFFDELQAYIESHRLFPEKRIVGNRGLLSKVKYFRKKMKAGKAEEWMVKMFETVLAVRSIEHT